MARRKPEPHPFALVLRRATGPTAATLWWDDAGSHDVPEGQVCGGAGVAAAPAWAGSGWNRDARTSSEGGWPLPVVHTPGGSSRCLVPPGPMRWGSRPDLQGGGIRWRLRAASADRMPKGSQRALYLARECAIMGSPTGGRVRVLPHTSQQSLNAPRLRRRGFCGAPDAPA
jgi:hypothetical protein